ncbi:hypothetical protein F2P79_004298 [Pimephales promelas]|nr:hypothetical protein F2P79_004298 [Pimephales promelas]
MARGAQGKWEESICLSFCLKPWFPLIKRRAVFPSKCFYQRSNQAILFSSGIIIDFKPYSGPSVDIDCNRYLCSGYVLASCLSALKRGFKSPRQTHVGSLERRLQYCVGYVAFQF